MNVTRDATLDVQEALKASKSSTTEPKGNPQGKQQLLVGGEVKPSSMDRYKHGDVIVGSDGIGGLVIDREKKMKDMVEWDTTLKSVMDLGNQEDVLFDRMQIKNDTGIQVEGDPAIQYIKKNPNSNAALQLIETKKKFRNYEIGPNGLVKAGDPKAKKMRDAMALVRSGKVRLPTVGEYEKQQRELKKQQEEELRREEEALANPPALPEQSLVEEESLPPLEEDPIEEKKEDPFIMEQKQKEIMESANMDVFDVLERKEAPKKEPVEAPNPKEEPEEPVGTQPINLAMLENALKQKQEEPVEAPNPKEEQEEPEPEEEEKGAMIFEIPEERVDSFFSNMPESMQEKVEAAKKIKIRFTKDLVLPRATRQITDINSYRRMAHRNVRGDIQAQPLLNSGYVGYFMPCGNLKWSNLAPQNLNDDEEPDLDIGKIAQFCYEQLQTTSIGRLSKVQFMSQTSASDLGDMLYAIMKVSLANDQEVNMLCGRASCQKYFPGSYSIAHLPNFDKLPDESLDMIRKLQTSLHMKEDAIEIHNDAPVMLQMEYKAKSTESRFVFKHRDISTVVDRNPIMEQLSNTYGNASAILSMYITDVYIKTDDTGDPDKDYARSTDPSVICEELFRLSESDLDILREIIPQIPSIETFSYSTKGEFTCPHCGLTTKDPMQDIYQMAFQTALKARFFV